MLGVVKLSVVGPFQGGGKPNHGIKSKLKY
jgi:hypothetical protein